MKTLRALLLAALITGVGAPALAVDPDQLPDIGSPAEAAISLDDEYRIGLMIVRGLRDTDQIIDDPEIAQYIDSIGHQLASFSQAENRRFHFFVVKDPTINATALPGGFICVNSGLLLESHNESELAGVMAHEIAHVTQRHIARGLVEQSKNSIVSTAAMLAAILVGAAAGGGGDAAMAGIAAAQTFSLQQQMTFSRASEIEADRVGMSTLANAGFDPNGMPAFFETMSRLYGGNENQIPAIVRSHPMFAERIAESKERAAQYPGHLVPDSTGYALTRERLRVFATPAGESAVSYYNSAIKSNGQPTRAQLYGKAIALLDDEHAKEAVPILTKLRSQDETTVQYHTALAQAQLLSGDSDGAVKTFEQARRLFPRNVPVTVRYAEALVRLNQAKKAHEILLDLFNTVPPTPEQARQIAIAANAAGDVADAYYYMAEYHLMGGDLPLAMNQLQLALAAPNLSNVQRARFRARLDEIRAAMPRRMPRQQSSERGGGR